MVSYASVDRIEGNIAVCEVELIRVEDSLPEEYATKPIQMMEVLLEHIPKFIGVIQEGDILIVEHRECNIICICNKDEEEKARRIRILQEMLAK